VTSAAPRLPEDPSLVSGRYPACQPSPAEGRSPDERAGSACSLADQQAEVPRPLVAAYVLSVTAVAVFLAAVGDWLLAGALIGVELLVSGLIALAIRRPPAPPRHPGGPRLGTPMDPGNPTGRRPSR